MFFNTHIKIYEKCLFVVVIVLSSIILYKLKNILPTAPIRIIQKSSYDHSATVNTNGLSKGIANHTRFRPECDDFRKELWKTTITKDVLANSTSKFNTCLIQNISRQGIQKVMNEANFDQLDCTKQPSVFMETNDHVALASFPGAGNTWVRHLLESASGLLTGSLYMDHELKQVFVAERFTEHVLVIKTHDIHRKSHMVYNKVILLIRNPIDSILSTFNFGRTNSHTKFAENNTFRKTMWTYQIQTGIDDWKHLYLSWLTDYKGPLYVLSYDKLTSDFFTEFLKLLVFLEVDSTYEQLWCTYLNIEGHFHRQKPAWMTVTNLVSPRLLKQVQNVTDEVYRVIKAHSEESHRFINRDFRTETRQRFSAKVHI